MLSGIYTASLYGLEVSLVTVETDVSRGSIPCLNLVGLPDATVREAKERVRSAVLNSGYEFPVRRITINLSPAGTKKEGSHLDLPMAVGILCSSGIIAQERAAEYAFLGELSLSGELVAVKGALPLVIGLRDAGKKQIILPRGNVKEAALIKDTALFPMDSLGEIEAYLNGRIHKQLYRKENKKQSPNRPLTADYADVAGQQTGKRVMTIGAAGLHGILLLGSSGCGKTMLAKRLPGILPEMSYEESLEVTKIYSIAGELTENCPLITSRPFRTPHHSASLASLRGGGIRPRPGELSMAHCGVLFLDEFPEFSRSAIELLRQPMEDGKVVINRVGGALVFPARTMLVAAANPCRCGHFGDERHLCKCTPSEIAQYQSKLSGPLLDRIDLHLEIPPVRYEELAGQRETRKTSEEMRREVLNAARIQKQRYKKAEGIFCNAQLTGGLIKKYCALDREGQSMMKHAFEQLSLSARSFANILRVARTIADLAGSEKLESVHLAEALCYRRPERLYERV